MQGYALVMVFNLDSDKILMGVRGMEPYRGMLNLINGDIAEREDGSAAAYRTLYNDAGVHPTDIALHHLLDLAYPISDTYIEIYVGRMRREIPLIGENRHLVWVDVEQDFADVHRYAGDGNIVHILEVVKMYKDQVLRLA